MRAWVLGLGLFVVGASSPALAQAQGQPPPAKPANEPGSSAPPASPPPEEPGSSSPSGTSQPAAPGSAEQPPSGQPPPSEQPPPSVPPPEQPPPSELPPPPPGVQTSSEAPSGGGPFFGQHVTLTAGLGLMTFTNSRARDFIGPGVAYTVRLLVGSQSRVGYEVAYIGSAAGIQALGLASGAVLVSNGVEGAVRLNLTLDSAWQPYLLAGAAWRHYAVTNAAYNRSVANSSDNVLELPLAAGITWRTGGIVVIDGRIAYRAATGEDLLGGPMGGGPGLSSWILSLKAGLEF